MEPTIGLYIGAFLEFSHMEPMAEQVLDFPGGGVRLLTVCIRDSIGVTEGSSREVTVDILSYLWQSMIISDEVPVICILIHRKHL